MDRSGEKPEPTVKSGWKEEKMKRTKLRSIILAGILAALSFVLMRFTEFPLIPAAPFLKTDLGDIPLLVGVVYLGPWYGVAIAFVKNLLFLASGGGSGGLLGSTVNFIALSSFAIVLGSIVKRTINLKRLLLGFTAGTVVMTLVMIPVNFWAVPLFLPGITRPALISYLFKVNLPFNLIKGALDTIITVVTLTAIKKRNLSI